MFGVEKANDRINDCFLEIKRLKDAISYKELDCGTSFTGAKVIVGASKEIREIKTMLYCIMNYLDVSYLPATDVSFSARIVKNHNKKGKK